MLQCDFDCYETALKLWFKIRQICYQITNIHIKTTYSLFDTCWLQETQTWLCEILMVLRQYIYIQS